MTDMPEKIWLRRGGHLEGKYIEAMPIPDAKLYHRDDIVKALEAQNKMLTEALEFYSKAWVHGVIGSINGQPSRKLLHDKGRKAREALAQQMGDKSE